MNLLTGQPGFANQVYHVLVHKMGATENWRENFIQEVTKETCREYRIQGKLGFGGKFWPVNFEVDYYTEDRTPERDEIVRATNARLAVLYITLSRHLRELDSETLAQLRVLCSLLLNDIYHLMLIPDASFLPERETLAMELGVSIPRLQRPKPKCSTCSGAGVIETELYEGLINCPECNSTDKPFKRTDKPQSDAAS